MNNWKAIVESNHAKTLVLPAGWDSTESIATQLECSVDNVRKELGVLIKNGTIETKIFTVWDKARKRKSRVTAYHRLDAKV